MAAAFIGVVVGLTSGTVYAVINPDEDAELDNPRLLLMQPRTPDQEALCMVRVPRGEYEAALSMAEVAEIIARMQR